MGQSSRGARFAAGLLLAIAALAAPLDRRAAATPQATAVPAATARVDREELMRVVRVLSAPSMEGRQTGTAGAVAARQFIVNRFEQIGLAPAPGGFVHPFTFVAGAPGRQTRAPSTPVAGTNVIGIIRGTMVDARTIVVSAHYDHVGRRDGMVYPGADDNASGIAALLAVARDLKRRPPSHTVVIAAFDAEEPGLHGARAFVKAPPVPLGRIALNVNFDMVSRNDRNEIFAAGTYHTPSLRSIVEEVQRRSAVTIRFGHDRPMSRANRIEDWTLQSDHGVFHEAGIPFFYFGVEDHPDYHKPTDTADKIDPRFFGDVVDMLIDFVETADRTLAQ